MARLEVRSEITGSVWQVLVKAGQTVDEDEALVILESMKMEIPLNAPERAVVTEVRVEAGESVAEGDIVVVMEA